MSGLPCNLNSSHSNWLAILITQAGTRHFKPQVCRWGWAPRACQICHIVHNQAEWPVSIFHNAIAWKHPPHCISGRPTMRWQPYLLVIFQKTPKRQPLKSDRPGVPWCIDWALFCKTPPETFVSNSGPYLDCIEQFENKYECSDFRTPTIMWISLEGRIRKFGDPQQCHLD